MALVRDAAGLERDIPAESATVESWHAPNRPMRMRTPPESKMIDGNLL